MRALSKSPNAVRLDAAGIFDAVGWDSKNNNNNRNRRIDWFNLPGLELTSLEEENAKIASLQVSNYKYESKFRGITVFFSILLATCVMLSGALDSSDLLLPDSRISLA